MKPRSKISENNRTEKRLNAVLKSALKKLGIRHSTAAIILAGNKELKALKARYYKKKRTKRQIDVLSFPKSSGFPHPEFKSRFLGEIYLNEDLIPDPERLDALLTHGLLHLVGFTHDKKNDMLKMQALEKQLMDKVNAKWKSQSVK